MTVLYEKLDQSRLRRWAALYKLEWLFARLATKDLSSSAKPSSSKNDAGAGP